MPPRKLLLLNQGIHREQFGRKVSRTNYPELECDRYYGNQSQFFEALRTFSKSRKGNKQMLRQHFHYIGYANTKLKFCTRCYDIDRKKSLDQYFIETKEKTQYKTIYCYGCMGYILRKHGYVF